MSVPCDPLAAELGPPATIDPRYDKEIVIRVVHAPHHAEGEEAMIDGQVETWLAEQVQVIGN
jgi:hypothetical protein